MVYQTERSNPSAETKPGEAGSFRRGRAAKRYGVFGESRQAGAGNGASEVCDDDGPLVKRLRRGPLTPQTWVRFPHGSPLQIAIRTEKSRKRYSSVGPGNLSFPISNEVFEIGETIRRRRERRDPKSVGVYDGEGPPVPIPNTEVKLVGGENTCLATDREDSTMPTRKRRSRKWPPFFAVRTDERGAFPWEAIVRRKRTRKP